MPDLFGFEPEEEPPKLSDDSFVRLLTDDVILALESADLGTDAGRRNVVRVAFVAIEGLVARLRDEAREFLLERENLSPAELALFSGETYYIDGKGVPKAKPEFQHIKVILKFIEKQLKKSFVALNIDFGGQGFQALEKGRLVRNRIVHPKSSGDLAVSDEELEISLEAFSWTKAVYLDFLEGVSRRLSDENYMFKRLFDEARLHVHRAGISIRSLDEAAQRKLLGEIAGRIWPSDDGHSADHSR